MNTFPQLNYLLGNYKYFKDDSYCLLKKIYAVIFFQQAHGSQNIKVHYF